MTRTRILGAVVLACSACTADAGSRTSATATRVTLANGIVAVGYSALPDSALQVAPSLRIGAIEGNPAYVFGNVRGIDATSDGTIYVLDYQASEIRTFDHSGAYLETIASRGEGPGEIGEANGFLIHGDSLLWIHDHGNWMMLALDRGGTEVTREPMHVLRYGYIWSGTVDRHGVFWKPASASQVQRPRPPKLGLGEYPVTRYMVSYDPSTEQTDTITLGDRMAREFVARTSNGGHSFYAVPFDPTPIVVVGPSGDIWSSDGATYRLARINPEGDTTLVLDVDLPAPPVTAQDRSEYIDAVVERAPEQRRVAEELAALMQPRKPAVDALAVDDRDRLWVRRTESGAKGPWYDVFDADGSFLASVVLDFGASPYFPLRVRGSNIYTLVTGDFDVPLVVRAPLPAVLR